MKILVMKTLDEDEGLFFEEDDVKRACYQECLSLLGEDTIEGCIENMKEGHGDCMECYAALINNFHADYEYRSLRQEVPK